jgi:hypothetical protein
MHQWVDQGKALLVEALHEGRAAAYALVLCFKDGAYYGSGCCEPDLDLPYLMHTLQWTAVTALADRGYRWYEIGHQYYGPTLCHPADEKECKISFFKRGLGGSPRLTVCGENYISAGMLRRVFDDRLAQFQALRESTRPGASVPPENQVLR